MYEITECLFDPCSISSDCGGNGSYFTPYKGRTESYICKYEAKVVFCSFFEKSYYSVKGLSATCYCLKKQSQGKNCVLLDSAQEFIEIEAWLLLTSFRC